MLAILMSLMMVEARRGSEFSVWDGLFGLLEANASEPLDGLPQALLEGVLAFSGGALTDDVTFRAVAKADERQPVIEGEIAKTDSRPRRRPSRVTAPWRLALFERLFQVLNGVGRLRRYEGYVLARLKTAGCGQKGPGSSLPAAPS